MVWLRSASSSCLTRVLTSGDRDLNGPGGVHLVGHPVGLLNEELNVHFRDEAEDLFPLLARRCTAEDAIEGAIARIRIDQDEAMRLLPVVRATLSGCLDAGTDLSADGRAILVRFAGHVRRHLVAENAILLPIARARLTRADLKTLSQRMRSRRGLSPRAETRDAE